jgi:hypothetical protein
MASAQRGGGENGGSKNFFVRLVQTSIILTALDRFCAYIYHLIKTGFFGYIFSSYRGDLKAPLFARFRKLKTVRHFAEFRYGICRRLESSIIINGVTYCGKYLLGCRLRTRSLRGRGLRSGDLPFLLGSGGRAPDKGNKQRCRDAGRQNGQGSSHGGTSFILDRYQSP